MMRKDEESNSGVIMAGPYKRKEKSKATLPRSKWASEYPGNLNTKQHDALNIHNAVCGCPLVTFVRLAW